MMKDKIVFFILGAILATIAYSLGCYTNEVSNLNADFDIDKYMGKTIEAAHITATHSITIGKMGGPMIRMYVNEDANIEISSHGATVPKGTQIRLTARDSTASIHSYSNVKALHEETQYSPHAKVSIITGSSQGKHVGFLSIEDYAGEKTIGSIEP